MCRKLVQGLSELIWESARTDLTTGISACRLVPMGATVQAILFTRVEPGGEFSLHADEYSHVFLFLEGKGKGCLGEESYDINPNLVVGVPAGTPHGYRNTGNSDLLLLTINFSDLDST